MSKRRGMDLGGESHSRRYSQGLLAGVTGLIVVVAMVLILASTELFARFVEPKPVAGPDVEELDPHLGWIPRPGTWRIVTPEFTNVWSVNSLTMAGPEVTDADLHAPVRVLALGRFPHICNRRFDQPGVAGTP